MNQILTIYILKIQIYKNITEKYGTLIQTSLKNGISGIFSPHPPPPLLAKHFLGKKTETFHGLISNNPHPNLDPSVTRPGPPSDVAHLSSTPARPWYSLNLSFFDLICYNFHGYFGFAGILRHCCLAPQLLFHIQSQLVHLPLSDFQIM